MTYIKKTIASWEIKYGQIALTGQDYQAGKILFEKYLGNSFALNTFKGEYKNKNFIHYEYSLRLSCKPLFKQLSPDDIIYLKPIDAETIGIYDSEPADNEIKNIEKDIPKIKSADNTEATKLFVNIVKENRQLRELNNELLKYKERIEKYQNLEYIFEDETFMENWLERNIHKAVPSLEIIDRQPTINWNEPFMRNKPDFFCLDKTTRELVIVENKVRGRHKKVETQYMTYCTWAKKNLDKINDKYKERNIKASDNLKFVIITDSIDDRLQSICEQFNISLVFIDGGVIFEPIVPYLNQ